MVSDEEFGENSARFDVTELSLNHSVIEGDTLMNFLRCLPILEIFYHNFCGPTVGDIELRPQKVGEAIQHLEGSLKTLMVVSEPDDMNLSGEKEAMPMGSLVDFEKLHPIATNASLLVGPPSDPDEDHADDDGDEDIPQEKLRLVKILPKIALSHCDVGILDQACELIDQKEEVVPQVEALTLIYRKKKHGSWRKIKAESHLFILDMMRFLPKS